MSKWDGIDAILDKYLANSLEAVLEDLAKHGIQTEAVPPQLDYGQVYNVVFSDVEVVASESFEIKSDKNSFGIIEMECVLGVIGQFEVAA